VRLNEKGHVSCLSAREVRFASARVCVSADGERTGTGGSLVQSVRPSSLGDSLLFFNPSSLGSILSFPQISLSVCGVDNPPFSFSLFCSSFAFFLTQGKTSVALSIVFIFSSLFLSRSSHTVESRSIEKSTRRIYAIISKPDTRFLRSCPTSFCSR